MARQLALFDLFDQPLLRAEREPLALPSQPSANDYPPLLVVPAAPAAASAEGTSAPSLLVGAGPARAGTALRADVPPLVTFADPAELRLQPEALAVEPQLDIFEGPHRERKAAEEALVALSPAGVRQAALAAQDEFPVWSELDDWQAWAESLAWLLGGDDEAIDGREACGRASSLLDDEVARVLFPRLAPALLQRVRGELAARACDGLVADEGPKARLEDGHAAGTLPLRAGNASRALEPLRRAVQAGLVDGATRAALGEALRALGETTEALHTWCDALLRDPATVDGVGLPPSLGELHDRLEEVELRGDKRAWVPVLADLEGLVPLPGWVLEDAPFGPVGAFALELAAYRHKRRAGLPRESLFGHKRTMNELAPALREWVRRL